MEIPTSIDVNLQQASQTLEQCLKTTSKFSGNIYQNICTGQTSFVPFGFWDYALAFGLLALGVLIVTVILYIFIDGIRGY